MGEDDDDDEANINSEYDDDSPSDENLDDPNNDDKSGNSVDDDEESFESEEEKPQLEILEESIPDHPNEKRITSPFLTKYEKARIIGVRAVQISKNSPLYLTADSKSLEMWDPLTIAEKELAEQAIPFIIRRFLPDGTYEDWKLS